MTAPKSTAALLTNLIQICLSRLATKSLGICGRVIYHWKGIKTIFPTIYYTPQKILKIQSQGEKKTICNDLTAVDQAGF